jgi:hypothetical protein
VKGGGRNTGRMSARYSGVASVDGSGFWDGSSSSIRFGEEGGDEIEGKTREKLGAKEEEFSAVKILSPT